MGQLLDEIGPKEKKFISQQKVFFVGTAPLAKEHRINVSPKAPGSAVVVLGPKKVAYADLTGSGSETAAHVLENQRMTLMFCNLEEGPPKILRLYGQAQVLYREEIKPSLLKLFPESLTVKHNGFRGVFILEVDRISSSCGYSLPVMNYQKTRSTLNEFAERTGYEGMQEYCLYNNSFSIDGLPSLAINRNKDDVIIPKPENGYIHGERLSSDSAEVKKAFAFAAPSGQQKSFLDLRMTFVFLVGAIFGSCFTFGLASLFIDSSQTLEL